MPEQLDPGGRFTIFSVITLAGAVFGAATGAVLGSKLGWFVAIIGGVAGLILGSIPGQWLGNYGIMSLVRSLNKEDTATLRERLNKEYFLSHLIVLVLLGRGEPRSELANETLQMLLSESQDVRWAGWRTLNLNFPEVAAKLEGIDPMGEPELYRQRVAELAENLPPE